MGRYHNTDTPRIIMDDLIEWSPEKDKGPAPYYRVEELYSDKPVKILPKIREEWTPVRDIVAPGWEIHERDVNAIDTSERYHEIVAYNARYGIDVRYRYELKRELTLNAKRKEALEELWIAMIQHECVLRGLV